MSTAQETAQALLAKGDFTRKQTELDGKKNTLANGKRYLIEMSNEVLLLEEEIKGLSVVDEAMIANLDETITNLKNMSIVQDAYFDGTKLVVNTDWMLAYTQNDEPLPIPPAKVTLGLDNSDFRAVCIDRSEGVEGIWTIYDVHPHINGSDGKPCIGTASCSITAMIAEHEYYAAMMMCIDFLQTVNEGDSAGEKWNRWVTKHQGKLDELLA